MDESEARRRFGEARVARFATVRTNGAPHVVPIVFALDGDTVYSVVDAKPKRSPELVRLQNIRANPRVSLLVDHYEEDWPSLWWVRADGEARVVEKGDEWAKAVELLREKYPQYVQGMARMDAAVVVDLLRWSSWSFT